MVFIFNQFLVSNNLLENELKKVYGLNLNKLFFFKKKCGLNLNHKLFLNSLNLDYLISCIQINFNLKKFNFGLGLKQKVYLNIKKEIDINSYKGFRHKNSFPVRGQHTRNNAKTCKRINFKKLANNL